MIGNSLGVGILGLGMAGGVMAPIIGEHPGLTLRGAADLDPVLRERFTAATGLRAEETSDALFAHADIDIIYIATPHQFHRDHAIAALKAGKHVVVEKPMALTIADCDAMIQTAREMDRVLIVGHSHGFDPGPRAIRSLIDTRGYGPVFMMTLINYTDFIYRPRRPEELDTSKGGGIFFNQLPHQIEMARVIANEKIRSVRCVSGVMDPIRPTQGHLSALITFANGASASIVYNGHDRFDTDELSFGVSEIGHAKVPAHGKTWRANLEFGTQDQEMRTRRDRYGYGSGIASALSPPPHLPHFGIAIVSCAKADIRPSANGLLVYGQDGIEEVPVPGGGTFSGQMNVWSDCYDAVTKRRPSLHDGAFARDTLLTVLAMLESSRTEREIILSEFSTQQHERETSAVN